MGTPRADTGRSIAAAIGLTILGAVVPGTGLIAAGRRRFGAVVLLVFVGLASVAGYLAVAGHRTLLHWSVQPSSLLALGILLPAVGVAWAAVVIATYVSLHARAPTTGHRLAGAATVTVLVLAILAPLAIGGRYALIQRGVIEDIFANAASKSATTQKPPSTKNRANVIATDPWSGQDRVNVLLMGGDGGSDRIGVRPDTLILASIDTHTGATALFSVPRNLRKIPFQPGSVLANAYPQGIYQGPGDDELEWMINSIYRNVPAQKPGLLVSDNPGADATKLAVSGALGVNVDYYVLVNLKGFEKLIDALGGITVNVNQRVAVGGEATAGLKPHHWIQVGPNQHFDGFDALWFARGRYGADDYQRMGRQRCVIKAIIDQANPIRLLSRYEAIAATSKHVLETDIPATLLPAFVDLSLKVKKADVRSIAFIAGVIDTANPDYAKMHTMVQDALQDSGKSSAPSFVDSLDKACAYAPAS